MNSDFTPRELSPGMGQAVAERTILRRDRDTGEFEKWGDVARRVAWGNSLLSSTEQHPAEEEFKLLNYHIGRATTLMSGRHLQHGDEKQPKRTQEVFSNCSTSATSFMKFYLLLNGSGVGRCYDDDLMLVNYDYAPSVRCVLDSSHPDFNHSAHESVRDAKHKYGTNSANVMWFTVPDSREGWAKALELWENATFEKIHAHKMLVLDFSEVRPKGSPIGGMQNRPASGPVALMDAFEKATKLKGAGLAPWKQAMYLDHYFAECVLVGGARRSSRMSTKHWSDLSIFDFIEIKRPIEFKGKLIDEITELKKENPNAFLWTSNNSVTVDDEFWKLVQDKKDKSTLARHAKKVFKLVCQYSYGDGTGEPGFINSHKLVQKDDGWSDLNRGDYVGSSKYQINDDTQILMSRLAKRAKKKKYHTIVNPCVTGETLILTDQGHLPIKDTIGKPVNVWNGFEWSEVVPFSTGRNQIIRVELSNGKFLRCTPYHRFVLSSGEKVEAQYLVVGNGLMNYHIPDNSFGQYFVHIKSLLWESEEEETFCFNEPKNGTGTFNGIVTAQCSEIALNVLGGFCVLADMVPFHADSIEEAEEAFRVATRALIRVNLMDSVFSKEVKRTNRIGVGLTGVHEFAFKFFGYGFRDLLDEEKTKDFWLTLARFNRAVREEAIAYSKELGVIVPHTMTTIKPSGSVSKLFGLTEGWHLPSMREFLRWVQFRHDDPLIEVYKNMGYPTRDLVQYKGTTIVGFPTAPAITQLGMGDKLVTAAEATPEEQYQWLMLGEKYWIHGTDEQGNPIKESYGNQISYTLKYKPDVIDFEHFKKMILKYQPQIRCCSVMPQTETVSYEYQPEEPISKEKFDELVSRINRGAIEDVGFEHIDCDSGSCPVDFKRGEK